MMRDTLNNFKHLNLPSNSSIALHPHSANASAVSEIRGTRGSSVSALESNRATSIKKSLV